jgi:hypothetical protein
VADKVHVLNGSLFEPVQGQTFDVIIDDVSAMSEEISRISPWYPSSVPSGGADGTGPTLEMLADARRYLNRQGRLYFPLISLSDSRKILDRAAEIFGSGLHAISERMVPFCDEFKKTMTQLEELRDKGMVDFVRKRSRHLWRLQIYCAEPVPQP